jgi:hypothetical protein
VANVVKEMHCLFGDIKMKLTLQVTSPPDRENVVVEIWYDNQQWGEVSCETGEFRLETYPKPDPESRHIWTIELDELMAALEKAKSLLN